mmetsp:Transcript_81087/g.232980  ORF Transcript_81087/g.232980 Transcript_81087/m.232980 type:complete len:207 (-) Transcript_81087:50-670(-)
MKVRFRPSAAYSRHHLVQIRRVPEKVEHRRLQAFAASRANSSLLEDAHSPGLSQQLLVHGGAGQIRRVAVQTWQDDHNRCIVGQILGRLALLRLDPLHGNSVRAASRGLTRERYRELLARGIEGGSEPELLQDHLHGEEHQLCEPREAQRGQGHTREPGHGAEDDTQVVPEAAVDARRLLGVSPRQRAAHCQSQKQERRYRRPHWI